MLCYSFVYRIESWVLLDTGIERKDNPKLSMYEVRRTETVRPIRMLYLFRVLKQLREDTTATRLRRPN
jgi:hypothetical protein